MTQRAAPATVWEVFSAFLKLGLTSFGGPIAHIGYFRAEFVERRHWVDDKNYSDLVALCQFLPGPSSSQLGFALGLGRAGWAGGLVAWLGFTMPSALALILFAYGVARWSSLASSGLIHGLKVMAVAVVAQAVWGMAKSLCTDRPRTLVAICATLLVLAVPSTSGQLGAIGLGALVGRWGLNVTPSLAATHQAYPIGRKLGALLLGSAVGLLVLLPLVSTATGSATWSAISVFYRTGALVFGGGHVVLPLLEAGVVPPGWVDSNQFLAGYGAAQAVPGPLFSFAAFLGAVMAGPPTHMWGSAWWGGLLLLVVIFLPAGLMVSGALPFWEAIRQRASIQRVTAGVNAAVVGILAAALYNPVWTSAIHSRADFGLGLAAFALLVYGKVSPLWVVLMSAACGWLMSM